MVLHVIYFQLKPEVDGKVMEELVRTSRSLLVKIPEVMNVRSGRSLDPKSQWQMTLSFEVASLEKLHIAMDSPFYLKFLEKYVKPHTMDEFSMNFELDPSKNLKYS
ncbi:MAG: hypothetical protein EAZ42_06095 [Verrucomicrobia bacterium]|nr:MAG: hypothetical protein EAZ42_06095 [Verrucomicrobiota bacterium]